MVGFETYLPFTSIISPPIYSKFLKSSTFELEKFYEFKGNINDSRLINKELNGEKKEMSSKE